ncbi:hypothetical protein [Cobetia amphilecti]|uniref:hypothetical protein n=1 Tax=Cobetia amphilecti TaxID=1055104 RepID=UPI0026E43C10|nr:hypothetical protein [Cobetia amphilecti]MDO6815108.1 hypothetical protein [Cobetia amphilecti]
MGHVGVVRVFGPVSLRLEALSFVKHAGDGFRTNEIAYATAADGIKFGSTLLYQRHGQGVVWLLDGVPLEVDDFFQCEAGIGLSEESCGLMHCSASEVIVVLLTSMVVVLITSRDPPPNHLKNREIRKTILFAGLH